MTEVKSADTESESILFEHLPIDCVASLERFVQSLQTRQREVEQGLQIVSYQDKDLIDILEREKLEIERQQLNIDQSYQAHLKKLEDDVARLALFGDKVSKQELNNVQKAIIDGDSHFAEQFFLALRDQAGEDIVVAAESNYQLGRLAEDKIDFLTAQTCFHQAVQWVPNDVNYLHQAGEISFLLGAYDKAIEYYERFLAVEDSPVSIDCLWIAEIQNNLGIAWESKGEIDKAIECHKKALASSIEALGEKHPLIIQIYGSLGNAYFSKTEYQEAIDYQNKALAIGYEAFGDGHPELASLYNDLGLSWFACKDYSQAVDYLKKALQIRIDVFGEEYWEVVVSYNNLGIVLFSADLHQEAIEHLTKVVDLLGAEHPYAQQALHFLGQAKGET